MSESEVHPLGPRDLEAIVDAADPAMEQGALVIRLARALLFERRSWDAEHRSLVRDCNRVAGELAEARREIAALKDATGFRELVREAAKEMAAQVYKNALVEMGYGDSEELP